MQPLPQSIESLIAELEDFYPPRCIAPEESPEAAHRYAGQVELVQALRRRFDWTREQALPKEILNVRRK